MLLPTRRRHIDLARTATSTCPCP
ncbi:putative leader peptide [Rhodococcus indonesiensis]